MLYLKVLKGAIPKGVRCSKVLYLKMLKGALPKGAQRCYTLRCSKVLYLKVLKGAISQRCYRAKGGSTMGWRLRVHQWWHL